MSIQLKFINRQKEQSDLRIHLSEEPNAILFLYGPKSCGKTALLKKVINALDPNAYAVNYLDLREVIIYDFKTFLNVFFPQSLRGKVKDILSGVTFNMGFFGVDVEEESLLKENAFKLMVDKLAAVRKRGVQPVIVIDEIQLLRPIYLNGERYLIDELFNLFIALTKVNHLAHVICATSDSYFIEELYGNAKLSKTCNFYKVDHLSHTDVMDWLTNQEKLSSEDTRYIWDRLGGSPWEIWQVLTSRANGLSLEESVEIRLQDMTSRTIEFFRRLNPDEQVLFETVSKAIAEEGVYKRDYKDSLNPLLQKTIAQDLWFFDPFPQCVMANSESLRWAFRRMFLNA
jgi:hypothetical protein